MSENSDQSKTTDLAPTVRDRAMAREDAEVAFMRPQGWDKQSWINHMAFRFAAARQEERERCLKIIEPYANSAGLACRIMQEIERG